MDTDNNHEEQPAEEEEEEKQIEYIRSRGGRTLPKKVYTEPPSEDQDAEGEPDPDVDSPDAKAEDDEEVVPSSGYRLRRRTRVIASDDDEPRDDVRVTRSRNKKPPPSPANRRTRTRITRSRPATTGRITRKSAKLAEEDDGYVDEGGSSGSAEPSDVVPTTPEPEEEEEIDVDADGEGELEEDTQDGRKYGLRRRAPVNYVIPPALDVIPTKPPNQEVEIMGVLVLENGKVSTGARMVQSWDNFLAFQCQGMIQTLIIPFVHPESR